MLLKPLIVHPLDIRYRADAAVVFVVGVTAAVFLVGINDGQNLDEMLPCVVLIVNQFIIEPQNLGAKKVRIPLIIDPDVFIQLLLSFLLPFQHLGVQSVPDPLDDGRPRIQFDGGDLDQRKEDYQRPAPRRQYFLDTHCVLLHKKGSHTPAGEAAF